VLRLTPRGIGDHLGLLRPIYARTAAYGHFGRPPESLARHFGATVAAA
jgi:S-adenosylmethionine synthetase